MSNTITNVTPQLLAQGLLALRENVVLPRLVSQNYQGLAQQKGAVINIPKPSSITARAVTPAILMNSNVDSSPTTVAVTMDRHYEAPFQLSDPDQVETTGDNNFIPMQASEAVKALANDIDSFIWGKHTGIFSHSGTGGTVLSTITTAASARTLLNSQLAPMNDRRGVLDPNAEGAMLGLGNILQFNERGDQGGIINGEIGRKLAIDWYMDQNITTYSAGVAWATGWLFEASATVAVSTATFTNATASGTILVGDIFQHSGQQYVITTAASIATGSLTGTFALVFYPPLLAAGATNGAVTIGGAVAGTDIVANLVFHRDAFVWVSRPLSDLQGLGNEISTMTDPVSGVSLRLELSRQYKQTTYSFDYLGGAKLVRAEFATKILG